MRSRRIPLLGLLLIVAVLMTACGGKAAHTDEPLKSAGVIRVGTEGVYSPFSYHDAATGQLVGYDVDVARAVADKLGVRVEFVETPWDSIFAALEANRFDVVANEVTITPERQAKYDLSQPYSVGEGVIVTRADDNSISSLDDLSGKVAAENATSNWSQIARKAGARVETVEGFSQAITLLNQGRVDVVVNDSIAVYAYLAETNDKSVKIAGTVGEKSEQGFAARKNSGLLPELNTALDELRADGTLAAISQKYLKANASGAPEAAEGAPAARSTGQLIADNLWPLAKAALTMTIPLTIISFVIGLVIALAVALARLSSNVVLSNIARFYISIIRGTPLLVQLFIVFFALPEFGVKIDPFPAAVIAFSLNVGGYAAEIIRSAIQSIPKGQWEAAETIGLNYTGTLRRIILPQAARVAVPPLSNTLISLVKDTSLASTILVTELLRQAQIIAAPTFEFFALYGTAAIYYWVICLVLSFGQSRLERRLERHIAR
ncbi:ABC transporter permease subunit [Mycobacterium sp. CBMA247]|nr:ABC transporter permease subunit [Mycolicibacterium sp. CBMA 329]MUL89659.1 ABC transporter permease subunit [Mycolicibacterium sp. CBMA 331]MUL99834.1 ABC transporter permease subunit [Mycolicibacterium sp. CBMA 334]MUM28761.1 ABC transporter permease subunit [Mycolicibacterium sp. CBMA 295]MUM39174.1 ABC transporter permease subunit [Mycolicibacterium sp. CBMA 247]MUM46260.1 ABC transporter permease subunit [Mycolicibacterium sp. CBMA 294]